MYGLQSPRVLYGSPRRKWARFCKALLMKHIIIGNGIIALTTAFKLLNRLGPADTITIIELIYRTGSATLAAAAILNSFAKIDARSLKSTQIFIILS